MDNAPPLVPGRTFPRRILAVDDDPVVREFLKLYLEMDGVQVDTADDGVEVIGRLDRGYDLLVLDLEMPQITGFEVLQQLSALNLANAPPVIVLTSRTDAAAIAKAFELGASAYLLKPVSREPLIDKISAVYTAATR